MKIGININNKNTSNFETADFQLASFLLAKGLTLIGFRATVIPRKKLFVFIPTDNLQELIQNFWAKKELVEPLSLFTAERELKTRLYSDSYNQFQKSIKEEE